MSLYIYIPEVATGWARLCCQRAGNLCRCQLGDKEATAFIHFHPTSRGRTQSRRCSLTLPPCASCDLWDTGLISTGFTSKRFYKCPLIIAYGVMLRHLERPVGHKSWGLITSLQKQVWLKLEGCTLKEHFFKNGVWSDSLQEEIDYYRVRYLSWWAIFLSNFGGNTSFRKEMFRYLLRATREGRIRVIRLWSVG